MNECQEENITSVKSWRIRRNARGKAILIVSLGLYMKTVGLQFLATKVQIMR